MDMGYVYIIVCIGYVYIIVCMGYVYIIVCMGYLYIIVCMTLLSARPIISALILQTTSFPSPITRGATWDVDLEREVTSAVADEVRGVFAVKGFGAKSCNGPPGCNVWRDPRCKCSPCFSNVV
jgi:hypothetical protein